MAEDLGGMQGYATESTLLSILAALNKKTGKDVKSDTAKFMKDVDEGFKDLDKSLDDLEDQVEDTGDTFEETEEKVKDFSKEMKSTSKVLKVAAAALVGAFGYVATASFNQLAMIQQLNSAGMNLGSSQDGVADGLATFSNAAETANLRFSELVDLQKQYGHTLNLYGIQRFAKVSKQFQEDMSGLGLTTQEAAGFVAEYLEGQKILGIQANLDSAGSKKRMEGTFESFDEWGKVLGMSREELMKQSNAIKEQVDVTAFLASAGENANSSFDTMTAMFAKSPKMLEDLSKGLATPILGQSEMYQSLLASGMTDAAEQFAEMHGNLAAGKEVSEAEFAKFNKLVAKSNTDVAKLRSQEGDSAALAYANESKRVDLSIGALEEQRKEASTQAKQAEVSANVQASITKLLGSMERAFADFLGNEDNLKIIEDLFDTLAKGLQENLPKIKDMMTNTLPMIASALGDLFKGLMYVLEPVVNTFQVMFGSDKLKAWDNFFNMDWGQKLVVGLVGLFAVFKTKSMIMSAGGAAKGLLGKGGAAASAGGGMASGKKAGKLLGGIGKGAGGIIKSVGMAFAKLGNPATAGMIVLGAGALGLGIAALIAGVGGGIAAALALINTTLPTFVENLKSFETIDGDGLTMLSSSMIDLGEGLGALGSGALAGAAGGFVDMLTGNDAISKLREFAEVGPELAPGLNVLGDAMIKVGPGFAAFGEGLDALTNYESGGLSQLEKDIDTLTRIFTKFDALDTITGGAKGGLPGASPALIYANESRAESGKTTQTSKKPGETTASSSVDSSMEINTLLQKQLDVLHVIAGSNIAQADNIKSLQFNEEAF